MDAIFGKFLRHVMYDNEVIRSVCGMRTGMECWTWGQTTSQMLFLLPS